MPLDQALDFMLMSRRLRAEEALASTRIIAFGAGAMSIEDAHQALEDWRKAASVEEPDRPQSTLDLLGRLQHHDGFDTGIAVVIDGS